MHRQLPGCLVRRARPVHSRLVGWFVVGYVVGPCTGSIRPRGRGVGSGAQRHCSSGMPQNRVLVAIGRVAVK